MPKRKGRGRPKGSSVQKKVKEGADGELDILDNQSNMLQVGPDCEEKQEAGAPKKKGRGRPKLSRVQNCQESVDGNLDSRIDLSNMVELGPGCEELQEAVMPKKKGRGRPKRSRVQNCQESANENLDIYIDPSNMMEISSGCKEKQEALADTGTTPKRVGEGQLTVSRVRHCQESADGNLDVHINPLVMDEDNPTPGCGEAQEADKGDTPKKRGRGRPRGKTNQTKHQQNADELKPKRKGRGRTRGLKVQMKRQQSADGKLDVVIHPTKLVAVGPGRKDFITDLSVIVRQNARHNVNKWRQVPQSTRDTIVKKILDNWRLPDTDMVRKAILDEAARLYRNWRNRLHDYYLTFETKDEALKHVPDDINGSDWEFLVDYFSSSSFEIMSTKNKVNKAKQRTNHTCGPKSFQAVSYDARDLVTGKEPDMRTLWQLTHRRANGEWVDEASKEINDQVAEQIDEQLRQLEDSEDFETVDQGIICTAFKSVVGKKSYMHGFEAGLRSSSSVRIQQLQAELEAQKRVTENARIECNEIRAKLVEVESQLEEERRKREEIEVRLLDRQKEMYEINSQVQIAIQSAMSQYRPPTTEVETSTRQNSKISELEAQLHEAEDVITDLRSELSRYGVR